MKHNSTAVILLAGGIGSRMGSSIPKQFLMLQNKPIVMHSFDLFISMPEVTEIVVVCLPEYRHLFSNVTPGINLSFASPGNRRQDSVYNGLQTIKSPCSLVCIHDAARPFITDALVRRVIGAAAQHGAAAASMPLSFTIKETDSQQLVASTPDRSRYCEIQTPQVIQRDILKQGFAYALQHNLSVTDDVSLVEQLKLPVKLVEGAYANLKITTQDDLAFSEYLLTRKCSDGAI